MFTCDLNWTYFDKPFFHTPAATAHDWSDIDPHAYFDWHIDFGVNTFFCHAYTFNGVALYPSSLGPIAPEPGNRLFDVLFNRSRKAGVPFCSYFCVGADLFTSNVRNEWVVPGSRQNFYAGFLAPESPWTDLLCDRIVEFLSIYPVEMILFDWFVYGSLHPDFLVQPAWFVAEPFRQIFGEEMPISADRISPRQSLEYKRQVLSHQFNRIRDAVHSVSPNTLFGFNVPFWNAAEELWVDHPMFEESDILVSESTRTDVMEWLMSMRKPHQRLLTTVVGRLEDGETEASGWKQWLAAGCDFFGYAWGTPPDFRPHPSYASDLNLVRQVYQQIS